MRADDAWGAEALAGEPPAVALLPEPARALHCWSFCGGWRPDLLPLYAAFYGLPDWDLTLELMAVVRTELNSR